MIFLTAVCFYLKLFDFGQRIVFFYPVRNIYDFNSVIHSAADYLFYAGVKYKPAAERAGRGGNDVVSFCVTSHEIEN